MFFENQKRKNRSQSLQEWFWHNLSLTSRGRSKLKFELVWCVTSWNCASRLVIFSIGELTETSSHRSSLTNQIVFVVTTLCLCAVHWPEGWLCSNYTHVWQASATDLLSLICFSPTWGPSNLSLWINDKSAKQKMMEIVFNTLIHSAFPLS